MRIVAGTAKGRGLRAPPGAHTRPTSDRVREALFSMLEARLPGGLAGVEVLDLYAGSGALSLEALSRGASHAVLVESSRAAQRTILGNAAALGLAARCTLLRQPVGAALALLAGQRRRFRLVMADPPYAEDPDQLLERVGDGEVVAPEGLLALEHSHRRPPGQIAGRLQLVVRRRHGDTELSLYELTVES